MCSTLAYESTKLPESVGEDSESDAATWWCTIGAQSTYTLYPVEWVSDRRAQQMECFIARTLNKTDV